MISTKKHNGNKILRSSPTISSPATYRSTIESIKSTFNPQIQIEGVVLTMYDRRNSLSTLVEEDVRGHFGNKVYKTVIPRNVRISEAPSHGKPVLIYDTSCVGSKAYIGLAKEVIFNQ